MEVKLWVPNFLKVNPDFKITWSGPAMPPGTLLYPYQSPVLQVINLNTFENCPKNVKEVFMYLKDFTNFLISKKIVNA